MLAPGSQKTLKMRKYRLHRGFQSLIIHFILRDNMWEVNRLLLQHIFVDIVFYCCLKLTLYLRVNPVRESRHPCVDSRLALLPTAVSPGCNAIQLETSWNSILVNQGTSRVSLQISSNKFKTLRCYFYSKLNISQNDSQIRPENKNTKLFSAHLTGVNASREIASTQHGVGDQFFAKSTLTSALRQQGNLGLHHNISWWAVCREKCAQ